MTINKEQHDATLVLALEGKLDTATAPALERVMNEQTEGITELILDMNKLTYVSSAGLRVILAAHKKMGKAGELRITGVCEAVMEVFELTGFSDVLNID